ncbi:hypothetical protein CB0940_05124 [Cercospora beticola]|uniref:Uncharacterized protein n=1 Tax=Cercospora beticola TaxID=122368 RepID=A0A2G5HL07_CERBT|nr:hypothetical protein CB0940_05124 [Cercospora beticola]PIA93251.1 hypothetical protein CB0940_05124 [Cercospora beticola]
MAAPGRDDGRHWTSILFAALTTIDTQGLPEQRTDLSLSAICLNDLRRRPCASALKCHPPSICKRSTTKSMHSPQSLTKLYRLVAILAGNKLPSAPALSPRTGAFPVTSFHANPRIAQSQCAKSCAEWG